MQAIECGDIAGSATMKKIKAHVLAVPYAGLVGHVNPLMSLCQQLAAEGDIAVTFAYSQSYFDRSQALLIRSPNGEGHEGDQCGSNCNGVRVVGVCDGLAYQEYLSPESPRLFCEAAIDMEDKLVELARSTQHPAPITCIIADVFLVSASSVARRLGIPYVAFWTQSAASFAAHVVATQDYSTLKGLLSGGAAGELPAAAGAGVASQLVNIPGCPALRLDELPTFLQSLDPEEYFFAYLIKCFASVEESCPHVLINTFEELEPESMQFINKKENNISAVGPLLPKQYMQYTLEGDIDDDEKKQNNSTGSWAPSLLAAAWFPDEKCLAWLDTHQPKSVLFVSFGSLTLLSQPQIEELASGLEASQVPFLMVVRESLMDGHSALFPTGFLDRMSHSGLALFVSWAPQLQVLAHPSIGAFLTHSGWNSTIEGISKGLPFLCWPYFVDQFMNSRCTVDAWQIGLDFKYKKSNHTPSSTTTTVGGPTLVDRHMIEDKIKCLMDPSSSVSIHKRSNQLRIAASKAVLDGQGSSHLKFKSFISWLLEVAS